MNLNSKIAAFVTLGRLIENEVVAWEKGQEVSSGFANAMRLAEVRNPWFDKQNLLTCLNSWCQLLNEETLFEWVEPYQGIIEKQKKPVVIGVIAAGNIPLVAFHDFLSIIITGNVFKGKLAQSDDVLLPYLVSELIRLDSEFEPLIEFCEDRLLNFDAVIATGS
ncbi:MAG: acyl-CoA reductase, partial [Flavobacteriales bacterium]|nr:acyl-CoA reductase [Flavobacteriales bacterium]